MKALATVFILILAGLSGCSSPKAYNEVFAEQTAIAGNARTFAAPQPDALRAVIGTLVQRGFSIDQTDQQIGLIKATRNLQDPGNSKLSYLLTATASVWASPDGAGSVVRLSASEQQIMHSSKHSWVPIIGLLIIPMPGKTYQTTVTKEGTITDAGFYNDFFAAVQQTLATEVQPVTRAIPAALSIAQAISTPAPAASAAASSPASAVASPSPATTKPASEPGPAGTAAGPVNPR